MNSCEEESVLSMSDSSITRTEELTKRAASLINGGQIDELPELLRQAAEQGLNCSRSAAALASIAMNAGKFDVAKKLFSIAIKMTPHDVTILQSYCDALMKRGEYKEAEDLLKEAIKANPGASALQVRQAVCILEGGRLEEYLKMLDAMARLTPGDPALRINRGTALLKMGRLEDAAKAFKDALKLDPNNADASFSLSLALLKAGSFKEGWLHWESRLRQPPLSQLREIPLPRWTPSKSSNARVLIRCEQGFGDIIQFSRFIIPFRKQCAQLSFVCRKELLPLFEGLRCIDSLLSMEREDEAIQNCDSWIPLGSLPGLFVDSIESIANLSEPHLRTPSGRISKWKSTVDSAAHPGKAFKVGLCWSGSQTNPIGRFRSIPFNDLEPLLSVDNISFFSLQTDEASKDAHEDSRLINLTGEIHDFADTAAIIESLDAVVSIDTAVAHLAGSIVKDCCVALCTESDWRWFSNRSDSPWYPTLRLFRQSAPREWKAPLEAIAQHLTYLARAKAN